MPIIRWRNCMNSDKKFSRYIIKSLMIFMGVSFIIIAMGIYFYRAYNIEKSTLAFLDDSQKDFGDAISGQLDYVGEGLDKIVSNNLIRNCLASNDALLLENIINTSYIFVPSCKIIIYDNLHNRFVPELTTGLIGLKPLLEKLSAEEDQVSRFNEVEDTAFITLFSKSIKGMDGQRIGTGFLLYDISKDRHFWSNARSTRMMLSRILIFDGEGRSYNLETGNEVAMADKIRANLLSNPSGPIIDVFKGEVLFPLSGYSNMFFATTDKTLNEPKKPLRIILFNLCVFVLILTLLVSVFIAGVVSKPLENMANEAIKIAREPSVFLDEEKAGYFEFKKLCRAFNLVLSSLFKAQEELKSKARKEIEASDERYRLTVEAAPDSITLSRFEDGRFLQVNEMFLKNTGFTEEEVIGKTPVELNLFFDPGDRVKIMRELREKEEINRLEFKFRFKDGRIADTLMSARRVKYHGEDCIVSITADYTEQKKAEEKIRNSYETLQFILDSMPTCIVIVGRDKRIRQANRAALEVLGYRSEEDVVGKICHKFICQAAYNKCPICDLNQKIDKSERIVLASDGREIPVFISVIPVKLNNEDVFIESFFDLTDFKNAEVEKKRLEGALQRASKMEAIGTMAGGVAHDLNNILSGIVGYPDLLLMDLPEDSRLRKPILTIQKSGEKAAAIVQDMLTLARRGVAVTEVLNLNVIIREYLKSPEHKKIMTYNSGVSLKTDLEPNLLNIIGSEVHLAKTLMNLISNSIEAVPEGGKIIISTKNEYIDMPISGYDDVNEGDYVVLTVSDNGIGIPPDDQERIFEPFYTKKKMGRSGTGLGMAVVWGTVKDHDGYIDLQSDIGEGSVFRLYFPVTRRQLMESESELPMEKYMGRGESVLVVDDVAEQREIAYGMLTKLGYSVATVSSGEEAVDYMRQNSADILVLDMIMSPGIDGLDTYKRILEVHPGQKAIVASGFAETERVKEAQRLGAGSYIKKPYLIKKIGPAIRKELDQEIVHGAG